MIWKFPCARPAIIHPEPVARAVPRPGRPRRPAGIDTHPLGRGHLPLAGEHRPRIDDALVFDHLIEVLVYGAGYERIADHTCSATTMRRRRDEWARAGLTGQLRMIALGWGHLPLAGDYDRMIGLDLADVAVDGCITKAPCGGQMSGRSPVDRGKGGLKRSELYDARGIPIAAIPAPANRCDHQLLGATLDALKDVEPLPERVIVHLGPGYNYAPCRAQLSEQGLAWSISQRGTPIQIGKRWVVEAANSWMNDFAKIRRCTERSEIAVQAYLDLAAAIITIRALIRAAWSQYRWPNRPRSPRIR